MTFIENWWSVLKVSAVTWISQILGYAMIFYGYVLNSGPDIQATMHFDSWQKWVPWVAGLAIAFGIPVARATKQQSVTNAANK